MRAVSVDAIKYSHHPKHTYYIPHNGALAHSLDLSLSKAEEVAGAKLILRGQIEGGKRRSVNVKSEGAANTSNIMCTHDLLVPFSQIKGDKEMRRKREGDARRDWETGEIDL